MCRRSAQISNPSVALVLLFMTGVSACTSLQTAEHHHSPGTGSEATGQKGERRAAAAFKSHVDANMELHKTLGELGYDTSEGEHDAGNAHSFLAEPLVAGGKSFGVNTAWQAAQPLGDYRNIKQDASSMNVIARLDAIGPWIDCRGLLIEILSDSDRESAMILMHAVRNKLDC